LFVDRDNYENFLRQVANTRHDDILFLRSTKVWQTALTSKAGGIPEAVGSQGYQIDEVSDAKAFANKIKQALEKPIQASFEHLKHFDLKTNSGQLLNLIQHVIESNAAK
jgi:glycosyltransferase involved in cell wall biosynthesis